ncbi:hypothetical protein VP01_3238g1 [Puccinia sorghi]|uniref:Uncharacterized protein n=1 Tax=Puccinia sorghi TaxID=27349 RepID=A0A0L6UY34_9BASI|nr:hypothetical protein VP01_3238g1 [Puccinia sorghi]
MPVLRAEIRNSSDKVRCLASMNDILTWPILIGNHSWSHGQFCLFRISLPCKCYYPWIQRNVELNLSTSFLDIAMTSAKIWGRESQSVLHQKFGVAAPYLIRKMSHEPYIIGSLEYQHQANPVQFPFRQPITKISRYAWLAAMRNSFAWSKKALSWTDLVKQPAQKSIRRTQNTVSILPQSMTRKIAWSGPARCYRQHLTKFQAGGGWQGGPADIAKHGTESSSC